MIIELLQQDGLNPQRKGSVEFCSPCPECGGDDRFIIKTDSGRYWCRQCNIKGDSIEYLRQFRGMSFKDAADYAGKIVSSFVEQNRCRGVSTKCEPTSDTIIRILEAWNARAEELITKAHAALMNDQGKLNWLRKERGLTQQTAEQFSLGWIAQNNYITRADWGLPEVLKRDTNTPKKLFIPAGLLIPGPERLRIRRSNPGKHGKYYVVPGSCNAPLVINSHRQRDATPAIIVESELDGLLLWQELNDDFFVVASGSTSNGPSKEMMEDLLKRPFVLIALDGDKAGGKASWTKWLNIMSNGYRTPIPSSWGNDHTEAYLSGHNLNQWLSAAYRMVMDTNMKH